MKKCFAFWIMAIMPFVVSAQEEYYELKPTYTGTVNKGCDWGGNWFIAGGAGANVFTGSPMGCGDMYDRIMPLYYGSLGKWFDSAWGIRASWEGVEYKDSEFKSRHFMSYHADLMCNILNGCNLDERGIPAVDCVPYVGLGTVDKYGDYSHILAISYGLMGRYHIAGGLHAFVNVGATRTFGDFDGGGDIDRLEDRFLTASAGLSLTVGRKGWRRVIDAEPYIAQNEAMRRRMTEMKDESDRNRQIIEEYRKILAFEGLLKKYEEQLDSIAGDNGGSRDKNDYSGMNSLLSRLYGGSAGGDNESVDRHVQRYDDADEEAWPDYYELSAGGETLISVPVFFFFKLGSSELTDRSQLVNLDEIVRVAGENGLCINVSGAADSATGTAAINDRLSRERTDYIVNELIRRGADEAMISRRAEGGVSRYGQNETNRNCIVSFMIR